MFENAYCSLVREVLGLGNFRTTRNASTYSVFGRSLRADLRDGFPILQGRKLYPRGVLGELAAMLRKPTCVQDFKDWGCNYWSAWAAEDGSLNLDYGNAWFDFNGFDQIAALKNMLAGDPNNRRMLISSWRPDRLAKLSLPCCHYSYQFYVNRNTLDMVWTQRSVDIMIGLPSDMIFAAAWLIAIANEFDLQPGCIKMDFGDTHIYTDHIEPAMQYLKQAEECRKCIVNWEFTAATGTDFCKFEPDQLILLDYEPAAPISFNLHR
jgi:thymidylate synthase